MFVRKLIWVLVWCILILALMGVPGSYIPETTSFISLLSPDKLVHLFLFGVLSVLCMNATRNSFAPKHLRDNPKTVVLSFGIVFGIITELLQYSVFIGRNGNVYDAIADSVGIVVGIMLYPRIQKVLPHLFSE